VKLKTEILTLKLVISVLIVMNVEQNVNNFPHFRNDYVTSEHRISDCLHDLRLLEKACSDLVRGLADAGKEINLIQVCLIVNLFDLLHKFQLFSSILF